MAEPIGIAPGLAYLRTSIANVCFAGGSADNDKGWVLIDAGVVGHAGLIVRAAEARFGEGAKPTAILLTHGHYDHVGCAPDLARLWNVPVYAHPLEFPYLTGKSEYPRKDPTVGGAMGFLSRFFPSRTVNLGPWLQALPADRSVPGLPGWTAIHTPGHAPGHVCFWRESDRTLVAGDVLATANLDSWRGIATQKKELSRPPSPFTYNWDQARISVQRIAALRPRVLVCGHGEAMDEPTLADDLDAFAATFAPPSQGRYVEVSARADEDGVVYEPPAPADRLPKVVAGLVAGIFLAAGVVYRKRGKKAKQDFS
jgi:glyoxylase-like metal-dependent hydrolase (beta-lactamase superfamily II)